MALETASFIDGLNSSNPAATDALAQADDHLRLIKAAIKATFLNITELLLYLLKLTHSLTQFLLRQGLRCFLSSLQPHWLGYDTTDDNAAIGVVSGSVSSGGSNGFSNSFNTDFTISGTTGGSGTLSTSASTTGSTTLSVSQIPSHTHDITEAFTKEDNNHSPGSERPLRENSVNLGNYTVTTTSTGRWWWSHSLNTVSDIPTHTHSFSDTHNFDVKYVDVIVCTKS